MHQVLSVGDGSAVSEMADMQLVGGMATVPACVGAGWYFLALASSSCWPWGRDLHLLSGRRQWTQDSMQRLVSPWPACSTLPRIPSPGYCSTAVCAPLQSGAALRIKTDSLHFYIAKVNYESPSFCNTCQSCNGFRGRWYYSVEFLCNISKITAVKTRSWEPCYSQASGWVLETLRICCIFSL